MATTNCAKPPISTKHTTHFINVIESLQLDESVVLASIDVSSLYTNIPHKEGIAACVKALWEQPNPDPKRPPAEIIGELINIALCNNVSIETCISGRLHILRIVSRTSSYYLSAKYFGH